jgi:hypothetical protein
MTDHTGHDILILPTDVFCATCDRLLTDDEYEGILIRESESQTERYFDGERD